MSRTCIEAKRYEIAQINEGKNLHPRRLPVRKKMCYFFMSSSAVLIYFSLDIDFSERKEDIAQLLLRFPQTRTGQNNLKYRGHQLCNSWEHPAELLKSFFTIKIWGEHEY